METPAPKAAPPQSKKLVTTAFILAASPLLGYGACQAAEKSDEGVAFGFYLITVALALAGLICGLIQIARGVHKRLGLGAILTAIVVTLGTFLLGLSSVDLSSGRALRRKGRARRPDATAGDDWCDRMEKIAAPAAAAAAWRKMAATEAASISAFAHLANELLAIGAPPQLIAHAHADALDEIRHAKLCYGVAAAMDGAAMSPAPFADALLPRETRATVESVAVESAVESALYEAAAARAAAALAKDATVPEAIRFVLRSIAVDEARHAQHGLEILRYCIARSPSAGKAVREALDAVRFEALTANEGLRRYGVADAALWRACYEEALAELRGELLRAAA